MRTKLSVVLGALILGVTACGHEAQTHERSMTIETVAAAPTSTIIGSTITTQPPGPTDAEIIAYASQLWEAETITYVTEVYRGQVLSFLYAWQAANAEGAARAAAQTPTRAPQVPSSAPRSAPTPSRAPTGGGSAPNSFLACVRNRESRGNYGAVNSSSGAGGAYQMMSGTSRTVAGWMGRPDLAGRPANTWTPADQDRGAAVLYQHAGAAPWAGPGC